MDNLQNHSYVLVNVSNKCFSGVSIREEDTGKVLLAL